MTPTQLVKLTLMIEVPFEELSADCEIAGTLLSRERRMCWGDHSALCGSAGPHRRRDIRLLPSVR